MLNETRLIGRLGADPDIKQTSSGKNVAQMSMSTWESWFNKDKGPNGEFETQTEWHRVIAWGDQVHQRIAKLKKGDLVLVMGSIRTRSYTDANNVQRWTTEIVGQVKPMPNTSGNASKQPNDIPMPEDGATTTTTAAATEKEVDDLPF